MKIPFLSQAMTVPTSQLYKVRGNSMLPNFMPGDRLLVSRRAYRAGMPARSDIVILRDPRDPGQRYLKRVVGLPGEEVRLSEGMLLIDGAPLEEPYLRGLPPSPGLTEQGWKLGDDEYFVMGDSRAHSTDSRDFGPADRGLIVGKAWIRCWPPGRWGAVG